MKLVKKQMKRGPLNANIPRKSTIWKVQKCLGKLKAIISRLIADLSHRQLSVAKLLALSTCETMNMTLNSLN